MIALLPRNEPERLEALRSYGILDTPTEPAFDDITRLAAYICETPIAVVNLIDSGRQWFKSEIGLGVRETPLDISICAHAILQPGLFIVPDTLDDPRFNCNPLVTGDPHLRFYAGALLQTPEGHALGTVCVLDYKPRELSEAQKLSLQSLARQAMAHLELRRALAVAEQLNRYRSRLMAVAGHDLKQPLQVASMLLDRIEARTGNPANKRDAARAVEALRRLTEDLDRLAGASRLEGDAAFPHPTDVPVAPILDNMRLTWQHHAERKGLRLRIGDCNATVRTDPAMLTTIVSNLVGNAIKYTKKGGVLVGCRRRGSMVSIEVLDTGIGIPPDEVKGVFRAFHQLDPEQRDGLGLGLSIVKRTAESLGHPLAVFSRPGKGSRFAVSVPLAVGKGRSERN